MAGCAIRRQTTLDCVRRSPVLRYEIKPGIYTTSITRSAILGSLRRSKMATKLSSTFSTMSVAHCVWWTTQEDTACV